MLGRHSNEAMWEHRRIVIKCARFGTTSVGVTYRMLNVIDAVIAAFQLRDGSFDLFHLSAEMYKSLMTPSRSTPDAAGRVGIVTVSAMRRVVAPFRTVRLA